MAEYEKNRKIILTVTEKQVYETKPKDTNNQKGTEDTKDGKPEKPGYMVSFLDKNSANNFANVYFKSIPHDVIYDSSGAKRPYINIVLRANTVYQWNYAVKQADGTPEKDADGKQVYDRKYINGAEIEQIYKENMGNAKFVKESGGSTYFKYKSDIKKEESKHSDIANKFNFQQKRNASPVDNISDEAKVQDNKETTDATDENVSIPSEFEKMLQEAQAGSDNLSHVLGE